MADVEMTECTLNNVEQISQGTIVQRQIEETTYKKILPKVHNDSVHEFEIESAENYIELNKTKVEVKLRMKNWLINYPIATLFKDVEIKLNDETITSGSSNFADRAIIEVMLTYNTDAVNSWLKAHTNESKIVTFRGKLHEDLFNQPKPFPSGNRLYIKFTRNNSKYC